MCIPLGHHSPRSFLCSVLNLETCHQVKFEALIHFLSAETTDRCCGGVRCCAILLFRKVFSIWTLQLWVDLQRSRRTLRPKCRTCSLHRGNASRAPAPDLQNMERKGSSNVQTELEDLVFQSHVSNLLICGRSVQFKHFRTFQILGLRGPICPILQTCEALVSSACGTRF